jgi:hypothetical protein
MRDEIKDNLNDVGFYIINLDTSNHNGTHWTGCFFHPLKSFYFDSYGEPPSENIKNFVKNNCAKTCFGKFWKAEINASG